MLIPIKDYAGFHGISYMTVCQRCARGAFLTAQKIGHNWYVDDAEKLIDHRLKTSPISSISHKKLPPPLSFIPKDYISLKEFAKIHNRNCKTIQQKAIRGGFKTAIKVGSRWFVHKNETLARVNASRRNG